MHVDKEVDMSRMERKVWVAVFLMLFLVMLGMANKARGAERQLQKLEKAPEVVVEETALEITRCLTYIDGAESQMVSLQAAFELSEDEDAKKEYKIQIEHLYNQVVGVLFYMRQQIVKQQKAFKELKKGELQ